MAASASEDPRFRFGHDTAHHTSMGRVLFESLSGQTFKVDFRYIKEEADTPYLAFPRFYLDWGAA